MDYALFLYAQDGYASTVAWRCRCGHCRLPDRIVRAADRGGSQFAYASLVDLRTGDVVWFNVLQAQTGDIRTPKAPRRWSIGCS
jgi:hypothetical protein